LALSFVTGSRKEKSRAKSFFKCIPVTFQKNISTNGDLRFAGSDMSAAAICATLLYIITNSHVQSTLLEEIRNKSISAPITDAEARKLPYLQAVIKEGLHIYPLSQGCPSKKSLLEAIRSRAFMCRKEQGSGGLRLA
jgi:hypothetical protein